MMRDMEIDAYMDMAVGDRKRKYYDYAPGSCANYDDIDACDYILDTDLGVLTSRNALASVCHVPKKLKRTPHSGPVPVIAPVSGQVIDASFSEGMNVLKGLIMCFLEATEQEEGDASSSEPPNESSFSSEKSHALAVEMTRETLVRFRNSRTGVFSMEDVLVDHQEDTSCPLAGLDNKEVLKSFKSFKKFDILSDHTGHRFSTFNPLMNQPEGWADRIEEEWTILEKDLPDTILVRVFKPKMDLLRAVIVGPKGTPYHDGLYFFDMFIPRSYPESPPVLWYNSGGLGINPNLLPNGGVELTMPKANGQGIEMDKMWVPGTSNLLKLLVSIQDQFFHSNPLRNDVAHARGDSVYIQQSCLLYNENTLLKSLKTMVYIMNKPPKNFEDFVVGHFRNRVCDILMACEAYMEGMQVGCFGVQMDEEEGKNKVPCTIEFRKDVATYIKQLVAAFEKIGASEAKQFLYLSDKDYAPGSSSAYRVPKKLKRTPHSGPVPVIAPVSGQVVDVLIHEGMQVKKGQTVFLLEPEKLKEEGASSSKQPKESYYSREKIRARAAEKSWKILVRLRNSRRGVFSMEDVSVDHQVDTSCSLAGLDNQEVLKSFKSFKKFDILSDHTGHRFSMFNPSMNHQPEGWADRIEEEWRILEKGLPDTIFVRVFKPKMDLLSAVIVGPKGTPYHDGLFFFDVFIPRSYPECPPLLWYHSGGLDINPNLLPCGGVMLSLPKINGQGIEVDKMWVPGSSNLLKLLVSVKDQFFIPNPLRNNVTYARGDSVRTKQLCLLYNENTLLKSLKTMVYIMNKQPKNFEDFVVGHFRSRVLDILMACQAYMDGMPVGCFGVQMDEEEGNNNKVPCTIEFKKDVATYIKQLVAAFERIGASEAKQFLYVTPLMDQCAKLGVLC